MKSLLFYLLIIITGILLYYFFNLSPKVSILMSEKSADTIFHPQYYLLEKYLIQYNALTKKGISEGYEKGDTFNINQRIKQISINMERWKQLPADMEKQYIMVNIADFKLEAKENDSVILDMNIIVGRRYRNTPVFSSTIIYLEFNPYWYIPPGIMKKDIIPKIKEDPEYLNKMNIRLIKKGTQVKAGEKIDPKTINWEDMTKDFPYHMIQKPGPDNPMGIVKYIFPNGYNVYLHDTPAKELFDKPSPMFSSGCIRVSKARELSIYLLKSNQDWNADRIDRTIKSGKTMKVDLAEPVRIYIQYFTAWVNKKGELQLREDIYNRDK